MSITPKLQNQKKKSDIIILQNIFLCVQQKKETYTGLQQLSATTDVLFLGGVSH